MMTEPAGNPVVIAAPRKQRKGKPVTQGKKNRSMMVRLDARFAVWLRAEAKREGKSVTELSRALLKRLDKKSK